MDHVLKIVKNEQYRHYKDRYPPWAKMPHSILDDYKIHALTDIERFHLVILVMLAGKTDNAIPMDPYYLQSAGKTHTPIQLGKLIRLGFIEAHPTMTWGEIEDWDARALASLPQQAQLISMADAELSQAANTEPEPESTKAPKEKKKAKKPSRKKKMVTDSQKDPLDSYPHLKEHYDEITGWLHGAHPDITIPKAGDSMWYQWRNMLGLLVRVDKFAEEEITAVLQWMWTEEDTSGNFSWCRVTMSIGSLRKKQIGDTANKFHKIYDTYSRASKRSPGNYVGQIEIGF